MTPPIPMLETPNGYTVQLSGGQHPAQVQIFTDPMSWAHVGLGIFSAFLPSLYRDALLTVFTGYQLSQDATGETWQRTGGEFIEIALGLFAGALLASSAGKNAKKAIWL